jgi:hypothetical protein
VKRDGGKTLSRKTRVVAIEEPVTSAAHAARVVPHLV